MRYNFIWRDLSEADLGFGTEAREALSAAWAALPLEVRKNLNSEWPASLHTYDDDTQRPDPYREAKLAVWRAYLDYFNTPGANRGIHELDMVKIRLLMAEFGMSFPDLPSPAFPELADYDISETVFRTFALLNKASRPATSKEPKPEDRRRLAEFGAALTEVASWHGNADMPGIPEHKLVIDTQMEANHRGWIIRDVECTSALRIWQSLIERRGEAITMRRIGAEFDTALWSGWLTHLNGGAKQGGLYAVRSLSAWSALNRLARWPTDA